MKYFILLMFSLVLLNSCSNERVTRINYDENLIAKQLKFVDVNSRLSNKSSVINAKSNIQLVIVEWDEWGRASRNCGGWGLCNADWFPQFRMSTQQKIKTTNGTKTILEYDSTLEKYYVDILLAESAPSEIPLDALTLKIDKNFDLNVENAISRNLTFNKGDYSFDVALGEYGGYRIYLD